MRLICHILPKLPELCCEYFTLQSELPNCSTITIISRIQWEQRNFGCEQVSLRVPFLFVCVLFFSLAIVIYLWTVTLTYSPNTNNETRQPKRKETSCRNVRETPTAEDVGELKCDKRIKMTFHWKNTYRFN